tara:strand:+ start:2095 stop:2538 length:444 start_codon:yes stop_codon:yes gene_type:complete
MAIVECEIINGQRYVYKNFQWVKVDRKGKLIKEYIDNDNGIKYIYFEGYGYQPETFKEHLKDGKADREGQLDYCRSVNCPDCYYCVWAENMIPKPKKRIGQVIKKQPKTKKWDRLAKNIANKKNPNNKNKHPLYDYIMEIFQGKEIK